MESTKYDTSIEMYDNIHKYKVDSVVKVVIKGISFIGTILTIAYNINYFYNKYS